jgi:hypothetical protein
MEIEIDKEALDEVKTKELDGKIIKLYESGLSPKEIKQKLREETGKSHHSRVYRKIRKYDRVKEKTNGIDKSDSELKDLKVKFTDKADVLPELVSKKEEKKKKDTNQEEEFKITHVDIRHILNGINMELLGGTEGIGWEDETVEHSSKVYARAITKLDNSKVAKVFFGGEVVFTTIMLVAKPILKWFKLKNLAEEMMLEEEAKKRGIDVDELLRQNGIEPRPKPK